LDETIDRPWERALPALKARARDLRALAITSDERVESYVVWQQRGEAADIVALGGTRPELVRPLLAELNRRSAGPIRMAKASESEVSESLRAALGFRRGAVYIAYAAQFAPS
jgi:hypothetical protein